MCRLALYEGEVAWWHTPPPHSGWAITGEPTGITVACYEVYGIGTGLISCQAGGPAHMYIEDPGSFPAEDEGKWKNTKYQ